jgi:Tfp pilus assembly protein PilX
MRSNKKGFVSIITVITISILLSLLTLSFVRIINRSQRQTLDSQLSTQANYAAETGINDALRAITNNPTAIPLNDTNCAPTPTTPGGSQASADANKVIGSGVNGSAKEEYTCQLISSGVKDVRIDINDQSSRIYPIKTDITPAQNVDIEWEDKAVNNDFNPPGGLEDYPSLSGWGLNHPAMLRITVYTPCPAGCADFDRAAFASQKNFFVKPKAGGQGTIDYTASVDGAAAEGR